jgi:hypothetical protein
MTPRAPIALAVALLLLAPSAAAQGAAPPPPAAAAPTVAASPLNLFGGKPAASAMLYATAGFPDIEIGARIPLAEGLELGPHAQLLFGRDLQTGLFAMGVAADLRWHLLSAAEGRLDVSLMLSLGVLFGLDPSGIFSIPLLWPGLAASYHVSDTFDVDFGLQLQDSIIITEFDTGFGLFVAAFGGVEGRVADGVQLALKVEMGPDIVTASNYLGLLGTTRFHLRVVAGVGFAL